MQLLPHSIGEKGANLSFRHPQGVDQVLEYVEGDGRDHAPARSDPPTGPARQSRASARQFQAVSSGLERTSVRATSLAETGSTMRDSA